MKKYMLTEKQVKKVIDHILSEQDLKALQSKKKVLPKVKTMK